MLPAAPELSSAAFYIAAGNYRKKTKRGLNWQEMENGRKYRKFYAVFRAMCGKDETNSCSFYKGWLNPG